MNICRYIRNSISDREPIPLQLRITEDEWQSIILSNQNLVYFADFANFEQTVEYINTAILLNSSKNKIARIRLHNGNIQIYYDKINDELIVALSKISKALGAYLLINEAMEYPKIKILAAQKRHSNNLKIPQVIYQSDSFGGNNMWLAVKAESEQLKSYFSLICQKEKPWPLTLDDMHSDKGILVFEFRGWTFLAGHMIAQLFAPFPQGEIAVEKHHIDKLLDWGKVFSDLQLYMHHDRSEYFNAFYRVLNGQLLYGEYYTETYQKSYGKIPNNIKKLPDNNANTIASEWSYDPDRLRYCEELKEATAVICLPK